MTLKQLRREERLRTAFHEAAHAVANIYCDKPLRFVTVKPLPKHHQAYDQRSTGYTHCDTVKCQSLGELSDEWIQKTIFVSLAGPATEFLAFPDSPQAVAEGDYGYVRGLAGLLQTRHTLTKGQVTALLNDLAVQVEDFVEAEADKIESVAAALLERDILTGDDVRGLCVETSAAA
jgi:ATP-dependent Zn protease